MKLISKLLVSVMITSMLVTFSGCGTKSSGQEGQYIIDAKAVTQLASNGNTVIVDMQKAEDYDKKHVKGAVNIPKNEVLINIPVDNMLAPKGKVEEVLSKNGISNDTTVIIYDNANNMDAARLWWTLMIYGHENIKVVSGGVKALEAAKAEMTNEKPKITPSKYTAKDKNTAMLATIDEVKAQVDDPKKDVILLDTRTQEEYNEGTIPGSILLDYQDNNYKDGTYKSIQNIKIQYIEAGIKANKTVIMYCKTSIRAAQTYLALYNAGYRNLKLYDGAWLEWSANTTLPVQTPSNGTAAVVKKNNS